MKIQLKHRHENAGEDYKLRFYNVQSSDDWIRVEINGNGAVVQITELLATAQAFMIRKRELEYQDDY